MFNKKIINRRNITTVFLIIGIFYFCFYFLFGKYGFINYTQTKREKSIKETSLNNIKADNIAIQSKINSLGSSNIDKDLLDEQVRKNLGYVEEDEIVIYYK